MLFRSQANSNAQLPSTKSTTQKVTERSDKVLPKQEANFLLRQPNTSSSKILPSTPIINRNIPSVLEVQQKQRRILFLQSQMRYPLQRRIPKLIKQPEIQQESPQAQNKDESLIQSSPKNKPEEVMNQIEDEYIQEYEQDPEFNQQEQQIQEELIAPKLNDSNIIPKIEVADQKEDPVIQVTLQESNIELNIALKNEQIKQEQIAKELQQKLQLELEQQRQQEILEEQIIQQEFAQQQIKLRTFYEKAPISAIKIQSMLRSYQPRKKLALQLAQRYASDNRGYFVYRCYKVLDQVNYLVNIYQLIEEQKQYTIELLRINNKERIRSYHVTHYQDIDLVLDTGDKSFYQYLLDMLFIDKSNNTLQMNYSNFQPYAKMYRSNIAIQKLIHLKVSLINSAFNMIKLQAPDIIAKLKAEEANQALIIAAKEELKIELKDQKQKISRENPKFQENSLIIDHGPSYTKIPIMQGKLIKKYYKKRILQTEYDIQKAKVVIPYEQESIETYIRLFQLESDKSYSNPQEYFNVNFLEILLKEKLDNELKQKEALLNKQNEELQRKLEYEEQQRRIKQSLIPIFNDYCVISGNRVFLNVTFNLMVNQFMIKAQNEEDTGYELNIDFRQVQSIGHFQKDFLILKVDTMIIKQLQIQQDELYYMPNGYVQEQVILEWNKWLNELNREVDLSNVVGKCYKIVDVFEHLNLKQKFSTNLRNRGRQIIEIMLVEQAYSIEYLLNLTDQQLIIAIQYEQFKVHIIPIEEFDCPHLFKSINTESAQYLIKLYSKITNAIQRLLVVDTDGSSNLPEMRRYISQMFFEQFAYKIQNMLAIARQTKIYAQILKNKHSPILIHQEIQMIEGRYIKIMLYLQGYEVKIVFIKYNDFDAQQNIIQHKETQTYYMDLLTQEFPDSLDPSAWLDVTYRHLPIYYKRVYSPLIVYILKNIQIVPPFRLVTNLSLFQKNESPHISHSMDFYALIQTAIKVQSNYKSFKARQRYQLSIQGNQNKQRIEKQIGKFVHRDFRVFNKILYQVNVHELRGIQSQFTIDLLQADRKRDLRKSYRVVHIQDSHQISNIGNKSFYSYLLDMLYIDQYDNLLKFKYQNFETYTSDIDQTPNKHHLQLDISENTQSNIIHHNLREENGFQTIYNVIHSGQSQLVFDKQENTYVVSVNLSEVKAMYPHLKQNEHMIQMLSQEMISGLTLNKDGALEIDTTKINPNFIQAKGQAQLQQVEKKVNNDTVSCLMKKVTYYGKDKYLLKINSVERRVTTILEQSNDRIFEHYEILYQVEAICVQKPPIKWEISIQEANQLTHEVNQRQIAAELLKRTLVIANRFIFLAIQKSDIEALNYPTALLFVEKGIRPIQNKFRNRRRVKAFKQYKKTLLTWKDGQGKLLPGVYFSLTSLRSDKQFITLCGEDKSRHIQFLAWDLDTFQHYNIQIPKNKIQNQLQSNKEQIIKLLTGCIQFSDELIYHEPSMSEIAAISK